MSDKFDDFEKDRREKEEIINNLKKEVSTLKGRVEALEKESNGHEQDLGRNCLLGWDHWLLGCQLYERYDGYIDLFEKDIDRSYWIRKSSPRKKRPVTVKIVRYKDRRNVFSNIKKLKDSGISFMENLTVRQMEELKSM